MEVEEDAPPSKFRRVARNIKITNVKLHSRLHIYDFVGYDINVPDSFFYKDFSLEPKDADDTFKKYARIGQAAAAFGDLEAIQYLSEIDDNPLSLNRVSEEHKYKLEDISIILLLTRNWKGLKWTIEKGYDQSSLATYYGIDSAISVGANLEVLKWLLSQGWLLHEYAFRLAVIRGDMDIMKWLHEEQCPWDENTFCCAVRHENMEILKWLKKEGCPWDEGVFEDAVETGNFRVLSWLRLEGCPWNAHTFSSAIDGGADLLTLRWLHDEKCPWDKYSFIAAVERGDLEILMWLHEKQCPWDAECIRTALKEQDVDVLEWIHKEKCLGNEEARKMVKKEILDIHIGRTQKW